jgi:hypothetical protein
VPVQSSGRTAVLVVGSVVVVSVGVVLVAVVSVAVVSVGVVSVGLPAVSVDGPVAVTDVVTVEVIAGLETAVVAALGCSSSPRVSA